MSDSNRRDEVIEHLRMIQGIVERLNANSFAVKRFALIVFAGSMALLSSNIGLGFPKLLLPIFILTLWLLDGFYLSSEKAFRSLFDSVRLKEETDFSMEITKGIKLFVCAVFSMSVFPIYLTAASVLFAVICIT